MPNPIKAVSRTYNSILADIDSDNDLKTKPRWWKRIWAGVGDQLNRMIDAISNLGFLQTAFTRKAVQDHLELIDYNIAQHETSHGLQRFNINDDYWYITCWICITDKLLGYYCGCNSYQISTKQSICICRHIYRYHRCWRGNTYNP